MNVTTNSTARNGQGAIDVDVPRSPVTNATPDSLKSPKPDGDEEIHLAPPPEGGAKKRRRQILAAAGVLLAGLACGIYYYYFVAPYQSTDDAFIEGYVIPIAPKVSGYVDQLLITDNQEVKKGDVLLTIDARDYQTSLAQARADLAAARSELLESQAQVKVSQAKVKQSQAAVVAAEAQSSRASDDLKRYQSVDKTAISRSAFDMAQAQARSASADLEAARSQALAAEANVTLSQAGVETATAAVLQAEAKLRQAELNLSYTKVTAPEDGRITRRAVEQGAYIQPGQSLMAIVPHHYWVIANYKELQLTHMRPGQPVEIKVDAYPSHKFKGHVQSIQSGSGARFSLFPPENATGNYIKVVQRVPVKIVFDDDPDSGLALGPGMSVLPTVRVK